MSAMEWSRRRSTQFVLAAVTVVTSLVMHDSARAATAGHRAPRFSGADLTRGVVFMQGPAAPFIWGQRMLTEFAPQIAKPTPHGAELFSLLTADEEATDSFAVDMQSGSPVRVERALQRLGGRLNSALLRIHGAKKMAAINRAGEAFVAKARRLLGSPDFASGTTTRDFTDAAPSGGWSGDYGARPRVPDVVSQNLLFFFRSANIFTDFNVFFDMDTAVQVVVLEVLSFALAAIIILFVFITLVIAPIPARLPVGVEAFLNDEFLARLARDLDAR